jgi:hypothetical protein
MGFAIGTLGNAAIRTEPSGLTLSFMQHVHAAPSR